ncbi:AIPR family protein [Gordonia tangerina]|uniref:AIPR family protein n=1 Tax=Gordonia tangerina TaxID=2911060 RepID=A0ABS9DNM4_9ACTN|nr:AIPR family protein [Gordonia tangerina]MCF3940691.1 AIPR family protein [Gordonia tangerina]
MADSPDQVIAMGNFAEFKTDNYPKLSDDDAFERFASSLLLRKYGADPADIERGLVSGNNDGGIDGIFLFLNRSESVHSDSLRLSRRKNALSGLQTGVALDVVIVQTKKEKSWDTNVFPKIESTLKAIFDDKQTAADLRAFPLNDDVIERAMTWRKLRAKLTMLVPVVHFHAYYASLAKQANVDSYMTTKANQLGTWLRANLPTGSTTTVAYLGDAELVTRLRDSSDYLAKLVVTKPPVREGKALVGLVSVKDYLSFIRYEKSTTIREEMFAANVRDYAGSNVRVNDAIGRTLANDSESLFWWLNNGITVIADKANNPLELEWVLTNPLIVNGLQTSHVIHEQAIAEAITKKRLRQSILVRVITESDPEVREAIIGGTNNQTAIASLQLHANEEKQLRIEEFLRPHGWYYERRRYQYRGVKVPASRIRNMTELGQAVMAIRLLQPDTARARPATLLGTDTGWKRVFDPAESEELYLKALVVLDAVDDYLRSAAAKAIADDSTNARFYLASGYVLEASGVKKLDDFVKTPSVMLKDKPTPSLLAGLHKLLNEEVQKLDDGKTALDRIFKGKDLKDAYFDRIVGGA